MFDEGQGNFVKGSSPNRNDGKFSNSSGIKWGEGKFGKALEFKGNDYVVIPHSASLDLNDTITIALWVKINTVGDYPSIMFKGNCGTPGYWGLHEIPGSKIIYARIDTTAGINQTQGRIDNASDGTWHHIVFVFDKGKIGLFLDGEELPDKAYNPGKGFGSNEKLGIGPGFIDGHPLDGAIDDVGIFNVALNGDDIKSIMEKGLKEELGIAAISPLGKIARIWANVKKQ